MPSKVKSHMEEYKSKISQLFSDSTSGLVRTIKLICYNCKESDNCFTPVYDMGYDSGQSPANVTSPLMNHVIFNLGIPEIESILEKTNFERKVSENPISYNKKTFEDTEDFYNTVKRFCRHLKSIGIYCGQKCERIPKHLSKIEENTKNLV